MERGGRPDPIEPNPESYGRLSIPEHSMGRCRCRPALDHNSGPNELSRLRNPVNTDDLSAVGDVTRVVYDDQAKPLVCGSVPRRLLRQSPSRFFSGLKIKIRPTHAHLGSLGANGPPQRETGFQGRSAMPSA